MAPNLLLIDVVHLDVLANFWASVFFFIVLPTFWKWWQVYLGRVLAGMEVLLLAAFTPSALGIMFGFDTTGLAYQWVTALVLAAIPLRLAMLLGTLFWLQMGQQPFRAALSQYFRELPGVLAAPWIRAARRAHGQHQPETPAPEKESCS